MSVHAREQLRHLSEISALLVRFESVEQTVPRVLSLMARTLHLRGTTLINSRRGSELATVWTTEGTSPARAERDEAHARAAYGYFTGAGFPSELDTAPRSKSSKQPVLGAHHLKPAISADEHSRLVVLPLVVEGGRTFGALQIDSDLRLDESDLLFVNAVVGQLAIAIDRQALLASKDVIMEASRSYAARQFEDLQRAERAQHLLADVGVLLAEPIDDGHILERVLETFVPLLADICFFEEPGGHVTMPARDPIDGDSAQGWVASALPARRDSERIPPSLEQLLAWKQPREEVIARGQPLMLPAAASTGAARAEQLAQLKRHAGIEALIVVPVNVGGRSLGALTFAFVSSARRYTLADLELAQQLAVRIAIALEQARLHRQLEAAVRARDEILGIVSHDLRSPLSTLVTSATLLRDELPTDARSDTAVKAFGLIMRSVTRMDRLINDLVDVASIDAGKLSIEKQDHDVNLLVAEALEASQPRASARSLQLRLRLKEPEIRVHCDRERILQVLLNLIGNAIKFTPRGGWIGLSAEIDGARVRVAVSDTGRGISPEQLVHVFERRWRPTEATSPGSGLGLFISKGIIEGHGGTIWAESVVGRGSTFFFVLPLSNA